MFSTALSRQATFACVQAKAFVGIYTGIQTTLVGQSEPGSNKQDRVLYNMDRRTQENRYNNVRKENLG